MRWFRRKPSRYERFVPKDIRRLGESRGIPKPNRWIPSGKRSYEPAAESDQ